MEVHRQSPIGPTKTVYLLTPPRRPHPSPSPAPRLINTPIQSIRKIARCTTDHTSKTTSFDTLLDSYSDWLSLHPSPTPTKQAILSRQLVSGIESCTVDHIKVNSFEQESIGNLHSSVPAEEPSKASYCSDTNNICKHPQHKHYILNHCSPDTLTSRQEASPFNSLQPLKLEDLLSDGDSSDDESNIHKNSKALSLKSTKTSTHVHSVTTSESIFFGPNLKEPTQLADRFYRYNLLGFALKGLVNNVVRVRQMRSMSISHHRVARLKSGMKKWKRRMEEEKFMMMRLWAKAEEFNKKRALEKSLLVWQAWTLHRSKVRDKAAAILVQVHKHSLFLRWKEYAATTQKLRSIFKAWRLHIYHCNLKQLCEAYREQKCTTILQDSFNQWILQASLHVGDNILCTKLHTIWQYTLYQKTFNSWLKVVRLSRASQALRDDHNKSVLSRCLSHWRDSYLLCHSLKAQRKTQLDQLRKKQFFDKWWAVLHQQKMNAIAIRFHTLNSTKKALHHMKEHCIRTSLLRDAEVIKEKNLLSACLLAWKQAKEDRVGTAMITSANKLLREHTLTRYFSIWRENFARKLAKQEENEHKLSKFILNLRMGTWKKQLHSLRIAREHRKQNLAHSVQRCFVSWRDITNWSYNQTALQFASKLHHLFSGDPKITYESMTHCLTEVWLNLGLISEGEFEDSSVHLKNSVMSVQLESFSDESFEVSNLSKSCSPCVVDGAPCHPPSHHTGCSNTSHPLLCACVKSDIAEHIHEVKQKLADLSASLEEKMLLSESEFFERADSHPLEEDDNSNEQNCSTDSYISPILTPPPEFRDPTCIVCPHTHDGTLQSVEQPAIISTAVSCIRNIQLYPCNKVFHIWRCYTLKKSVLRSKLKKYLQVTNVRSTFYKWRCSSSQSATLNELEIRFKSSSTHKLLTSSLKKWREECQKQTEAVNLYEVHQMRRSLKLWKDYCDCATEINHSKADCLHQVAVLKKFFKCWLDQTVRRHLVKRLGLRWKRKAKVLKQENQAFTMLKFTVMSNVWGKWRKELVREQVSKQSVCQSNHLLLKQVFAAWQIASSQPL